MGGKTTKRLEFLRKFRSEIITKQFLYNRVEVVNILADRKQRNEKHFCLFYEFFKSRSLNYEVANSLIQFWISLFLISPQDVCCEKAFYSSKCLKTSDFDANHTV